MARHIGGAVNYVAVAGVLDISPNLVGAGLAADNLMNAIYFAALFAIARSVEKPKEDDPSTSSASAAASAAAADTEGGEDDDCVDEDGDGSCDVIFRAESSNSFDVLKGSYALSLASVVSPNRVLESIFNPTPGPSLMCTWSIIFHGLCSDIGPYFTLIWFGRKGD